VIYTIGLGTVINALAILAGGAVGLVLKRFLSSRVTDTVTNGMGLSVVIIGVSGALGASFKVTGGSITSEYVLLMIISLTVGAFIGESIGIEERLNVFAGFCEKKLIKPGEASTFSQGFVTATLLFCVGSMAIVGALEDGISRNIDILAAKSVLDGVGAMVFASTMGVGVLFSAASVAVYQGLITVLAMIVSPFFTDEVVRQISLIGAVLILGTGLNLLRITKIKVSNLLPAVLIPIVYYAIKLLFFK